MAEGSIVTTFPKPNWKPYACSSGFSQDQPSSRPGPLFWNTPRGVTRLISPTASLTIRFAERRDALNTITMFGVTKASLSADDFLLA